MIKVSGNYSKNLPKCITSFLICFVKRNSILAKMIRNKLAWLTEDIDKISTKEYPIFYNAGEAPELVQPEDTYRNIGIRIHLEEYKYDEKRSLSIVSDLTVNFEAYIYIVQFNNAIVAEKSYDGYLNSEERKQIITNCTKYIFDSIKKF